MPGSTRSALVVLASLVLLAPGCAREEDNEAFFNRTAPAGYSEPGAEKIQYGSTGGQRRPEDPAEKKAEAPSEPAKDAAAAPPGEAPPAQPAPAP